MWWNYLHNNKYFSAIINHVINYCCCSHKKSNNEQRWTKHIAILWKSTSRSSVGYYHGRLQVSVQSGIGRECGRWQNVSRTPLHARPIPARPGCHNRRGLYDQNGRCGQRKSQSLCLLFSLLLYVIPSVGNTDWWIEVTSVIW